MFKKGSLLVIIIILAFLILYPQTQNRTIEKSIERVVLITLDTVRADHLGYSGYVRNTSPFLDNLSKQSVVFTKAFTVMSHTLPAHVSLFTSLFPLQHGSLKNISHVSPELMSLGKIFDNNGYSTAGFVGVYFLERLTDHFNHFDTPVCTDNLIIDNKIVYRPANRTVDNVINWLNEKGSKQPFFLWLHLYDAHDPYRPPEKYRMKFEDSGRDDEFSSFLFSKHYLPVDFFKEKGKLFSVYNNYDGEILFIDHELQRLYTWAKKKHLLQKSLWIVTADHGEGLGNHYYMTHEKYIYNEQLHVPLMFHSPDGLLHNRFNDDIVGIMDVVPTLVDLIPLSISESVSFCGSSLLPQLFGDASTETKRLSYSQRRPKSFDRSSYLSKNLFCVQDEKYKLIKRSDEQDQFFDLGNDPGELNNLIHINNYQETIQNYYSYLDDFIENMPVDLDQTDEIPPSDPIKEKKIEKLLIELGYVDDSDE